jgi:hypothetical protein
MFIIPIRYFQLLKCYMLKKLQLSSSTGRLFVKHEAITASFMVLLDEALVHFSYFVSR